jgi:hypothetical protein
MTLAPSAPSAKVSLVQKSRFTHRKLEFVESTA